MANHQDMIESVEVTYAQALLEMADEAGTLEEIADEVGQLAGLLESDAELGNLLSSRALSTEDRAGSIEAIFKDRINDLLYRFLLVVNDKQRLSQLADICQAFRQLHDEKRGLIDVDAFLAQPMSDEQASAVASRIGEAIGKQVTLRQHVDEALLGGLKLRIGDQLIDGSVATQLKLMKYKLIETGRERARQTVRTESGNI